MALLQRFPKFEANVQLVGDELTVVDARPEVVAFIAGSNLKVISERILQHKFVQVDAAPGAGKSTILPKFLVQQGVLVVHVLPYVQLAAATYRRFTQVNGQVEAKFVTETAEEWPESGYVVTYAGCLVAKWLTAGAVQLPSCVLLHDESHESDAASAIIRDLARTSKDLVSYVRMSATSDPTHYRNGRLAGQVIEREYQKEAFDDPWTVADPRAPWSVAAIEHFMIVYEDDEAKATDLLQAYGMHGISVFRWTSATDKDRFLSDVDMIDADPDNKYVAIVDSTYRSGYTFNVDTIIDSGVVTRKVVENGHASVYTRPVREFEVVQTKARGGRLPGLRTIYWRPRATHENVLCTLEQTDIEAYVLMCHLLRVTVPTKYAAARMNAGLFPKEICAALNDGSPLALIPDADMLTWEQLKKTGDCKSKPDIEIVKVPDAQVKSDCYGRKQVFEFVECAIEEHKPFEQIRLQSNLLICNVELSDLSPRIEACFPRGFQSLVSYYQSSGLEELIAVLSELEVMQILQMAIDKHNSALLTVRSIDLGLQEARGSHISVDPKALRTWVIRYTEKMVMACAQAEIATKIALMVAEVAQCQLRQCECDPDDFVNVKVKMKAEHMQMPKLIGDGRERSMKRIL